jgi:guanylate cyclase
MHPALQRFIDRIDNAATLADDPPPVRLRKTLLIFLGAAGVLIVPWGALYLARAGLPLAAAAALGFSLLSAAALAHLLITKREAVAAWLQLTGLLLAPLLIQWMAGGFAASGAAVLWSLLSPLCALVFLGTRAAIAWFAGFALLVLALGARDIAAGADAQAVLLLCENMLIVSCLAFIALRFFIVERDRAQAALEREQERSERLLLNILPAPIAERLKAGHKTLADGYAEATILFADLVGFTRMSATVRPERLVEVLNALFSRFDQLSERYGVEKIKTIGDAYMVCAGLPVPRPDHAEAIADMALGMRGALEEHNREFGSELKIRIGINTGPVVAGVIGLKKFIYDLWGDTVNLASRMESHGVPDGIQVSAATWARLRERYDFVARGPLEVKGIGQVQAYLLIGTKGSRQAST